jgi:hypothetical protein
MGQRRAAPLLWAKPHPARSASHPLWFGAIVALAALFAAPAMAQNAGQWVVDQISGQVRERGQDGAWHSLATGAALEEGNAVETGGDGKLVLMHGKDVVTVAPNSSFQVPANAGPALGPSLLQTLGTLMFRVEHAPGRHFEIDAPHLAAVVKGTVFTVTASPTADSVHVAEGAVEVTTAVSHKVAFIRGGQTAVVSSAGRDLSVLGRPDPSAHARQRSEIDLPTGGTKAAALSTAVGEEPLDIAKLTHGLIGGNGAAPSRRAYARANNPNAAGNPHAEGWSPNAFVGNLNASNVANANAVGGSLGGSNSNAVGNGNGHAGGNDNSHGGGNGNGNGNGNHPGHH